MRVPGRVWFLIVLLAGGPGLAGCLGGETGFPQGPEGVPTEETAETGPLRVVTPEGTFPLGDWMWRPSRDLPSVTRLGQLDHWETDQGAMRLLTDGQAFVLVVDQSIGAYGVGTVVLVKVYTDDGGTVATGLWEVRDEARTQVPIAVFPNDIIRFGLTYRYEVIVFVPNDRPDCRCLFSSRENEAGLEVGFGETSPVSLAPGTTLAVPTNAWNGTLLGHRDAPLSFRPSWDLAFDGPTEGTDKPDAVERYVHGGPETGLYVFTFTGTRVWLVDAFFDLGRSRVAGTEPHMNGNGSSVLQIQLDGSRPLETFLDLAPTKGLDQEFTLKVHVDHETRDDLPGEEEQFFFATAAIGYRLGGSTYVADTAGRDLVVQVTGTI